MVCKANLDYVSYLRCCQALLACGLQGVEDDALQ